MQLDNQTPYPAALFRGVIRDDRLCASLVARVTYDIVGTQLVPSGEQVWPVFPCPWTSPYGPMVGDELFYRGGVDVFAFGAARAPNGRAVPRVDVRIEVGEHFSASVAVFGDRVWERRGGTLVASAPVPFVEGPLTIARAFGGTSEWDSLCIPYQDNPDGIGYYLELAQAQGRPLPNVEDPGALVARWDDRPEPVGVAPAPPMFGPRLRRTLDVDEASGTLRRIDPAFFNAAFPALVVPRDVLTHGAWIRVSGMTTDWPLVICLPPAELRARLRFGDVVSDAELLVDQIGVEVDAQRAFITYRYPFRYRFEPLQLRACELVCTAAGGVAS